MTTIVHLLAIAFATVIAAALIYRLIKKSAIHFTALRCGNSGWCRTTESFVVVFVLVVVLGALSFFEHRRGVQEAPVEIAQPASIKTKPEDLKWIKARLEECRQEKDRADAAVLKFRVDNQLDSMIGQCESLKLAYNQLLVDLAQAESRMSNETVAAEIDLLRRQTATLREQVAENVRARAELQDGISKEESKLSQLESARELAYQNLEDVYRRMEEVRLSDAGMCGDGIDFSMRTKSKPTPVWTVSATLDGRPVSGAILSLNGQAYVLNPDTRIMVKVGSTYGPGEVTFARDGRTYSGTLPQETVHAGWNGGRKAVVALTKRVGPNTGSTAGELKTIDLGSQAVRLHWCPAGSFIMGSPSTEDGHYDDELQHRVKLTKGFWIGETEVTQGLWKEVMGSENVFSLAMKGLHDDNKYFIAGKMRRLRDVWGLASYSDPALRCGDLDDQVPVYNVSWNDADDFCRRLTARARAAGELLADCEFCLPTEAQWEYACRAGRTSSLPNGEEIEILGENNAPALDDIAWYGGNSSVGFEGRGWDTSDWKEKQYPGGWACVREVQGKAANAWGLYDMIGNVSEWCSDWYGAYSAEAQTNPFGASKGRFRVNRGGSWGHYARGCRPAHRFGHDPNFRGIQLGFRIVLLPIR